MDIKRKRMVSALVLLMSISLGYAFWLSIRPVEIVAVHEDSHYSSVLVKQFPITDKGKINWWLQNKGMLKQKYGIPKPSSWGHFSVMFWIFGDGYQEEGKYDRLCFTEMKTEKNCIDKNKVFTVGNDRNGKIVFTVEDGRYRLEDNGELTRLKGE
ncbi:DUF943 family protein [Kosakonia sp. H02]|nr:DUF943 family protein [Kosakonia sp. H02]